MNYAEILKRLQEQREAAVAKMQGIHSKAVEEGRTFSEAEQGTFAQLKKEVESIDAQIQSTKDMETLMGQQALPIGAQKAAGSEGAANGGGGTALAVRPGASISLKSNLPKGTVFTRYAMALAASKGNLHAAAEMSKNLWGDSTPQVERIIKAAVAAGSTTDTNWAKPLAEYRDATGEFIELLRPATIIGRMAGFVQVPFNVRIPRQTAGTSVGWVGQASPKAVNRLQFDSVVIPITKIAGIVVITQELARFSQPSAEALVRSDMIQTIATYMDSQMIDPAVTSSTARPASVTNGVTGIASTGATLTAILTDTTAAMLQLANSNIPMQNWYWIMHPRTAMFLMDLRTAQDVYAFPGLQLPEGQKTFRGFPVIISTGVPVTDVVDPGTDTTIIILVAAGEILLADDGEVMLDVSTEAAVAMDDTGVGTLTSLWQNNLIGLRAERYVHWLKRRNNAVAVIEDVAY